MSDPFTILGAVVAATQLAEQSLRITVFLCQLNSQFRTAQKVLAGRVQQIEELVNLCRQVISNPALHTESNASIVNLCLHEAVKLHRVLQRCIILPKDGKSLKLKKSLNFVLREKDVIRAFDDMGRIQALLALSVTERTSSMIQEGFASVQSSLGPLATNTSSTAQSLHHSLPAIFTQLAAIEQRLDSFSNLESKTSSRLKPNMEQIIQHAMMNQQASKLFPTFASKIMTHYYVPLIRSKSFKPFSNFRTTVSTLSSRFTNPHSSSLPHKIVTLAGVSCGGKTQAALEFCKHARDEQYFGAIFCVQASSVSAREKGFKRIADMLNVPTREPLETRINIVMAILQAWPCPWLLVFDNYRCTSAHAAIMKDLGKYMPKSEQGSILITRNVEDMRRRGEDFELEGTVVIPELRLGDAVELLLSSSRVYETDENHEQGMKLALALEKRPRALMQAGTYIRRHNISIAAYHELFKERHPKTVAKLFSRP